MFDFQVVAE